MTKLRPIFAVLAVLTLGATAASGSTSRGPSPSVVEIEIEAPAELSRFGDRLRSWQPERLSTFADLIGVERAGVELPIPIRVVLAPEGSALDLRAPSWVAGYARSNSSTVVLFPFRVPVYPYRSLEELLGHEVAHVMIFRAAKGRPLPRWFNEGLAMLAEEAWGLEDRSRVALAVLRQGRSDLKGLDRRFEDPRQVRRAYALSGAFVRDLVNRHGSDFPALLLADVAAGVDFAEAFESASGRTLAQAEESFWRRFTFWYRWLPFLTSSTAVWMLIVALTLLAGRRRRLRAKALEEQWEREDAWATERRREVLDAASDDDLLGPVN